MTKTAAKGTDAGQGSPASSTDRIEKQLEIRAPRSRVWRAITTASEFRIWFGMDLAGEFTEGATLRGSPSNPRYAHMKVEMRVERIDAERYFAYRWHPYPNDATKDYSQEPMTLVEFILEEAAGGTQLTIIESGFDRLPADRRAEAFRANEGGWKAQIENVARHVTQ
jgi:uncharacterized protein YndB with AHSA1/START domain